MKKLIKRSLVIVVALTTMVSYSNELSFSGGDNTDEVTNVIFNNVEEESTLLVKDGNGTVLHKELIENSGTYTRKFDLTSLPEADYYFEIDNSVNISVIPFTVKATTVVFDKDEEYIITKPEVKVENNLVYVSKKLDDNQSVKIDVFYEGFDLAYAEKFREANSVSRIFDFSTSKKGNYIIVIKSEGRVFRNSVNI